MASRRRNWNSLANLSQIFFPSWVYDQFAEGKNVQIEETTEEESKMVNKMILVALWCIQMRPSDHPSVNKVVEMLEGNIKLLHPPPKPFLYSQGIIADMVVISLIKKFRDALAKHSLDRCSLGPPKGLEEKELLALAANKDLSFNFTPKPEQTLLVLPTKRSS
ncbi:hypothetical protein RHMOL_Rhmol09G0217300 [Rhododendron molle]|uniref:Uncharacterized protein n=1 Tax=Rhododendron molle TaxID=49168 RepID=A0ACC0MHT6_RHOML|nr:hypothetical protein RHMOL_Rhmol09G0217300 [Rhododendron molle]